MKKINFYFIPMIIFSGLLVSCLSTPQTEYDKATKLREKAQKYELEKYAEEEYKDAEAKYGEAKGLYESKKNFKAKKALVEVNESYQAVLDKGLPPCAEDHDKYTKEEKKTAEDIKANVAVKDQFAEAEKIYEEAVKLKDAKEYEKAIEQLDTAKQKFNEAFSTARTKRDNAKKSIDSTEDDMKEVEENAKKFIERINDIEKELESDAVIIKEEM